MSRADHEVRHTGGRGPLRTDGRFHVWRVLDLIHDGRTFLRRRGVDLRWFGVLVHQIDAPDPGIDLHDHPWPFVSIILRGGYTEQAAQIIEPDDDHRYESGSWGAWLFDGEPDDDGAFAADLPVATRASMAATLRAQAGGTLPHERSHRHLAMFRTRTWRRWSVHRMPIDVAHRIVRTEPGTVTLVLRGRKVRRWGFFMPPIEGGWVDWEAYDYVTRRPGGAVSNKPGESHPEPQR